ncbi:MAG: L-histidine N(alpha)-methyltransferase [Acidobacteriaceae bacterium]
MNSTSVMEISEQRSPTTCAEETSGVARAVLEGLSATQKYLPSWLFYDAAGSHLFEDITKLPEYYLTALEHSIFVRHADAMVAAAARGNEELSVLELGAGNASKTIVLLRALVARQKSVLYLPVDVSRAALRLARSNVHAALPSVQVRAICSEITREKSLHLPTEGRRLALYIGSSIGNFDPADAVGLLRWLRQQLQPGDALLLGTDMVKEAGPLLAAYNDRAGVTAAFNKNILLRINRELGANFAVDAFAHRAIWNPREGRMEMHLDSTCNQSVRIGALHRSFEFRRGESIHTENSYKFTAQAVEDILLKSGYVLEQSWYDRKRWFGVHLARIVESDALPDEDAEMEAA